MNYEEIVVPLQPQKQNVDRFGLLATTVKNAKRRMNTCHLAHLCPTSFPIHY